MTELNRYVSDGKKENIVRTSVTEFDGDLSYANFTSELDIFPLVTKPPRPGGVMTGKRNSRLFDQGVYLGEPKT